MCIRDSSKGAVTATAYTKGAVIGAKNPDDGGHILGTGWLHHAPRVERCAYRPVGVHASFVLGRVGQVDLAAELGSCGKIFTLNIENRQHGGHAFGRFKRG